MSAQRGFTLIELAIVLVLLTVLAGGLLMPLSAQVQARRIAETRTEMAATRDALLGFAMSNACSINCTTSTNFPNTTSCNAARETYCITSMATMFPSIRRHYLPCPDINGDGQEDRNANSGGCINPAGSARGGLPWLTLGLKGFDAWGNRFTYAVTSAFAAHSGFFSTPAGTPAEINIFANRTCTSPHVAENIPFVVVSHGPNGFGATNINGGTPLAPASMSEEERQNLAISPATLMCPSIPNHDFTDRSFIQQNPGDTFDDILMWVSPGEIFNRVCPAGGCP